MQNGGGDTKSRIGGKNLIINLEAIAHKLTVALYGNTDLDELEKAKIEYGLSLTLGVGLALALALIFAALLGTVGTTLILILSALALRIFSGGAHCTSYDRCLTLSVLVFVPAAYLIKLTGALCPELQMPTYLMITAFSFLYFFINNIKLLALVLLLNAAAIGLCYLFAGELVPTVLLSLGAGLFVQTAMLTKPGQWFVGMADKLLKIVIS